MRKILAILSITLLAYACVPVRDQVYVQNPENNYKNQKDQEYKIEIPGQSVILDGDELYISVKSADEGTTMYNESSGSSSNNVYLQSFTVNESGEVKLPYINNIKVLGLTIVEAEKLIEKELSDYLFLPSVRIKKVNTKISVMGEVNSPGVYFFDGSRVNIFEAISYAGDITTYGNRKRALIIKEDEGIITKNYIDLTRDSAINSEKAWVYSGDIIFIEPLPAKKWAFNDNLLSVLITLLNTGVLFYTLLITGTR